MSQAYHRPGSLQEAIELAATQPGARFIAGGTDLMVQMRRRPEQRPAALISLRGIEELGRVEDGAPLRLGAGVPLADLARSPLVRARLPALAESFETLGSRQIRNVATLGGNLCNASPCANTAPPLLVYDARFELCSARGVREVPAAEFFLGPGETALGAGEILGAVLVDPPPTGARSTFLRQGRVSMDLALASIALLIERDGARCTRARVAAGAVAPTPLRLVGAEGALEGSDLGPAARAAAVASAEAEISPIDDLRTSAWYRTRLIAVLLERALASVGGGTP